MSSLEGLEELTENLLLGLLAGSNVWVLLGVVDSTDVVDVDEAGAVLVEDVVSLGDDGFAVGVHWATDSADEFVVLNESTLVVVEEREESADFTLAESEHVILHGLVELVLVERHGVVIVHNSKLLAQANDSSGTTGSELLSQALEELLWLVSSLGRGRATDVVAEDSAGELSVLKSSRVINIVKSIKSV